MTLLGRYSGTAPAVEMLRLTVCGARGGHLTVHSESVGIGGHFTDGTSFLFWWFSHISFVVSDVKRAPEPGSKGIFPGECAARDSICQGWGQEAPRGPAATSRPELPEGPTGSSDRDNSSDELNSKFRSQCLHSSSSSSSSSSACEMAHGPAKPAPLSRSPSTNNPFPNPPARQSGASMTLPKVRTPLVPRDSIQLVKKHYSQPQPSLDRLHLLNVSIDITSPPSTSSTLKSTATAPVPFSQVIEETDIDDALSDSMEGVVEGSGPEEPAQDGVSFVGLAEELDRLDPEVQKPPTPPLHRFPSWV